MVRSPRRLRHCASLLGWGRASRIADTPLADPNACGPDRRAQACAHWAKFPGAVGAAIGAEAFAACETPPELKKLAALETRKIVLPATGGEVRAHVRTELARRQAA